MTAESQDTKKAKQFQELRREAVGAVKVIEIKKIETGDLYYRTECRRKNVSPKTKSFPTWKKAYEFATKQNLAIETGRVDETDDVIIHKLKQIQEKLNTSQILSSDYEHTIYRELTLERIFDAGIELLLGIDEINKVRIEAGIQEYSPDWALREWRWEQERKLKVAKAPKISRALHQMLQKKISRTGGKGNRELQPKTKKEWKYTLEKLERWIGDMSIEDSRKALKAKVIDGINNGHNETGKAKGEFWSEVTKHRFASKASEFGHWMVNEEYWESNHFKTLPGDFTVETLPRAITFEANVVFRLFLYASKEENRMMIPYLAFIFFSGARPYEIAGENKERRFDYADMMGWKHKSNVTGGVEFEIKVFNEEGQRSSKGSRDRYADLAPAGVEWIQWYFKNVKGESELPTSGKIEYSRRKFDRIKKEALESYWPQDVARHTFTSLANRYEKFKTNNPNYWLEKCGHTREVFDRKYNAPKTQEECEMFFNLTPSRVLW